MATIQVTFPKKVSGIHERDRYELEQFDFEADDRQSTWEQSVAAFEEACRRGHDPRKNIRMHWKDGSPVSTPEGESIDWRSSAPTGRENATL